jgi:predicted PurR-regulated permease PerM
MSIKDIIQPRFLHVFMILFLFIFFIYLFILQKNVIEYRTIKTFINDNIPSYIENQEKYIKKECNELNPKIMEDNYNYNTISSLDNQLYNISLSILNLLNSLYKFVVFFYHLFQY